MEKQITILHANDLHGSLNFTVNQDLIMQGGISLLSGYVKKVRRRGPVFFGICGDILQEDIWGSDYKGKNTVELINALRPDAISLGNHELDYGLAHLMVFRDCLSAPVLCANFQTNVIDHTLFTPSLVQELGGVHMLLIGLIPKAFFDGILTDGFSRSMLVYRDSYEAIREEIQAHRKEHIDLVVLMSHYGIEGDRELAENLPPDLHVDLILGGHTHIKMDEAEVVNGIPIAQSNYGTTHIGRFDLVVDTEKGGLKSWQWQLVPLTEEICRPDEDMDEVADKVVFERKGGREDLTVCRLDRTYTHKSRLYETDLGNLIADAFAEIYKPDFVWIQSGSLRREELGPEVTERDFNELYPFDDQFLLVELTGSEIKNSFQYLFSLKPDGSVMGGTFQYSRGFFLHVDARDCWEKGAKVVDLRIGGKKVESRRRYRVGMTQNCMDKLFRYFGFSPDPKRLRVVSLSTYHDLVTFFLLKEDVICAPERGRFRIDNFPGMPKDDKAEENAETKSPAAAE